MPVKSGISKIKDIAVQRGYRIVYDRKDIHLCQFIKRTIRINVRYGGLYTNIDILMPGEKPYHVPAVPDAEIPKIFENPDTYERPR